MEQVIETSLDSDPRGVEKSETRGSVDYTRFSHALYTRPAWLWQAFTCGWIHKIVKQNGEFSFENSPRNVTTSRKSVHQIEKEREELKNFNSSPNVASSLTAPASGKPPMENEWWRKNGGNVVNVEKQERHSPAKQGSAHKLPCRAEKSEATSIGCNTRIVRLWNNVRWI